MTALSLQQLTKIYNNDVKALDAISLEVEQGDFFALLGPNGAGKSTTIGVITSLIKKTQGRVHVLGYDLDQQTELAKRHLGLVPQEFNFNGFERVKDILLTQAGYYGIPVHQAEKHANRLLEQLDLWHKRDTLSRTLSGGMKRRLMIARALIHHPKLLILDEPTAGVDIELRRSMWSFLQEINDGGTTIILTTHYLEEAENLCRHIAIINQGRIIENTGMKVLLNRLDKETLILDLSSPLQQPLNIPHMVMRQIDATTIEVDINKQEGLNNLFLQLSKQQIIVKSMRNKANRLEELFLSLVDKA